MINKRAYLWRYLSAEIYATAGVVFGTGLLYLLTENRLIAAYVGAVCENIGYYGYISIHDFKKNKIKYEKSSKKFGITGYLITVRNIIFEFSFSEILDSLLARPFCLYWFPIWINNFSVGIIAGKLAADIFFYIPTLTALKIRTRYMKLK